MSRCIDPKIGKLLVAYELNALSEDDSELIENHLMVCDHCFNELESFRNEATLLSDDARIKGIVRDAARKDSASEAFLKKLRRYVWPDVPVLFKPALAYLLILIMLVPAYRGFIGQSDEQIGYVRTVRLLPDRSGSECVLDANSGKSGLLSFVFRGAVPGDTYSVVILTDDGEEVFRDDSFDGFDQYETGQLLISHDEMSPGGYRLVITDPRADVPSGRREYNFRIGR